MASENMNQSQSQAVQQQPVQQQPVQQQPMYQSQNQSTQQPMQQPAQPAQQPTVIVMQGNMKMGSRPQVMMCPTCGEKVQTQVEYNSCNAFNWVICIFTGLCCVFIPKLCDRGTNTATHSCPNCGAYIGDNGHC